MLTRDSKDQRLKIEGVRLATLARRYGTPLYIYSYSALVENFTRVQKAFETVGATIAYSMKANSSAAILRALIRQGAGLDIVSGGELARALRAKVDPGKVIFAGVGKTREEIEQALGAGIRAFNVESESEAAAIDDVARRLRKRAPINIRVNPDVEAGAHEYITTGRKENKFGIAYDSVNGLLKRLSKRRNLELIGLHAHIGSQITEIEPFVRSVRRVAELVGELRAASHAIEFLNLGGGFGIAYEESEHAIDVEGLAAALIPLIQPLGVEVFFEPGRYIVGPAGFLLTRVEYIKTAETKNFAIVDGAMNDLLRPALYAAYHRIVPEGPPRRGRPRTYDVVGPVCESGDFLAKDRSFAGLSEGDLLLVRDAGAYGMVMASNYNSRPRPAEVLIRGNRHYLTRPRETIEEVIGQETVPDFLANSTGGCD